jgi:hypothetical protein
VCVCVCVCVCASTHKRALDKSPYLGRPRWELQRLSHSLSRSLLSPSLPLSLFLSLCLSLSLSFSLSLSLCARATRAPTRRRGGKRPPISPQKRTQQINTHLVFARAQEDVSHRHAAIPHLPTYERTQRDRQRETERERERERDIRYSSHRTCSLDYGSCLC